MVEHFLGDSGKGFYGDLMLNSNITDDMFKAGASSTVPIEIEPQDIRPTPEAVARYFGGPDYQMTSETYQQIGRAHV